MSLIEYENEKKKRILDKSNLSSPILHFDAYLYFFTLSPIVVRHDVHASIYINGTVTAYFHHLEAAYD